VTRLGNYDLRRTLISFLVSMVLFSACNGDNRGMTSGTVYEPAPGQQLVPLFDTTVTAIRIYNGTSDSAPDVTAHTVTMNFGATAILTPIPVNNQGQTFQWGKSFRWSCSNASVLRCDEAAPGLRLTAVGHGMCDILFTERESKVSAGLTVQVP